MLDLRWLEIRDDVATSLARGLAKYVMLKRLYHRGICNISKLEWLAFFAIFRNPNFSIEHLDLFNSNNINDTTMLVLLEALHNNNKLKALNLRNIVLVPQQVGE